MHQSTLARRGFRVEPLEPRTLLAQIAGSVFLDFNGNGVNSGQGPGNNTQTIFLDQNDNGIIDTGEASTPVDGFGDYFFSGLAAGTYRVRLMQDAGYVRTSPASGDFRLVTVSANQNVSGINFSITQSAELNGTVFNDANGNRTQDAGEPILPGATVFLDRNGNGVPDSPVSNVSSADVPKNTTGFLALASNLNVSGLTGLVQDVNVTLTLSTGSLFKMEIWLENPQGVRVPLLGAADLTSTPNSGGNLTNTTYDDQATKNIGDGTPPFTGTFRSSGAGSGFGLDHFNDLSPNGTWRLIVQQRATPTSTTTLKNWSMKITAGDPQTKSDASGNYFLFPYPGSYTIRAARTNFITTQPSSGSASTTLKIGDDHINNIGLREILTDNFTVKFNNAANLNKGTSDSPWGVITGDFNKDGKIDIAASNNGSNDVAIYLGKGNGQFNNPVFYPVGNAVRGIASGDFNKDGNIDLVTANHDGASVSILLGNGNGTFKTQKTFSAGTGAWAVVDADFNGDGKLDLAVADQLAPTVSILLGKGDGTFGSPTTVTVPFAPSAIRTRDMNGDGKMDLITAESPINQVSILISKGNGTFNAPININVGRSPTGLAVEDFNGDGKKDIAITNADDNNVEVLINKGNNTFAPGVLYAAGDTPAAVTAADVNKDGKLDLIVSNRSDGGTPISGSVTINLGNGDGTFQPAFSFTAHTSPVGTAFADFNGDGRLDLAVANFNSDDVSVLLNATVPITTGNISGSVFLDSNENGKKDSGENGLSGVTIFIDANKNGVQDSGERSVKSDNNGNWSFTGLTGGTYRIRAERSGNVIHTLPAATAAFYDVTVTPGLTAGGKVFGIDLNNPPFPFTRAIDAGYSGTLPFSDNLGRNWQADPNFASGGTVLSSAYEVANTDDDELYYSYRQGTNFTYTISVPNGTYAVDLLFAEPTKTAAGQRKFSVKAQGATVLSNFDIFAAGGAKRAVSQTFDVTVTNGKLVLQFIASVDQALVSAIDLRTLF